MAQPTEIYVDPSIAGDSGAGTSADPYGDLEWAIEQTTFDTANGTRVNIKAGTDEALAVEISAAMADTVTTVAWLPSEAGPCVFQGYTAVAGDGGIGGISGGGSVSVYSDTAFDHVSFIDLHCHNTGSATVIEMDKDCNVIRCEVDNTTGAGIHADLRSSVMSNHVHNCGAIGISLDQGMIAFNYLENGANDFTTAIKAGAVGTLLIYRNIVSVDGTSDGIAVAERNFVMNNSVWSNGGTGQGILAATTGQNIRAVMNNLVEGFSGVGGVGFDFSAGNTRVVIYGGNAAYNNTTDYNSPSDYFIDRLGTSDTNEVLGASPFTAASTGDFSPVDTGSVKEGSLPADFAGQ